MHMYTMCIWHFPFRFLLLFPFVLWPESREHWCSTGKNDERTRNQQQLVVEIPGNAAMVGFGTGSKTYLSALKIGLQRWQAVGLGMTTMSVPDLRFDWFLTSKKECSRIHVSSSGLILPPTNLLSLFSPLFPLTTLKETKPEHLTDDLGSGRFFSIE